ncbi:MAG TPA: hypothetical protein ENI18_11440 [Candidatus Aminicenantes bacterium]|nr:hypothetical protein [Candidatus Aminicenantes bacterium]
MKGAKKISRKIKFNVLIIIMFLFNVFSSNSCSKGTDETTEPIIKMNILVVFNMSPSTIEYKDNKKIPVYAYDPRKEIKKYLKDAGIKAVAKDDKPHELKLEVEYHERARGTSRYAGDPVRKTSVSISDFSFTLYDGSGQTLLYEQYDPAGEVPGTKVIDSLARFNEKIPQLILGRLEAEDEVSFLISRIKKEDFLKKLNRSGGLKLLKRIEGFQDRRAIDPILPFLRVGSNYARWRVKYTLFALGYEPQSIEEKSAWEIIDFERPMGLNRKEQEAIPWGVRRMSRGAQGLVERGDPLERHHFIVYYGLHGIKLLLEDLKRERRKNVWSEIIEHAKSSLCLLTKENWKRAWGQGHVDLDEYFSPEKITYLSTEELKKKLLNKIEKPPTWAKGRGTIRRRHFAALFRQEWNSYTTENLIAALKDGGGNDRYLNDVIYILGEIAAKKAIDTLNTYLSDYAYMAEAKKAIQKIESR